MKGKDAPRKQLEDDLTMALAYGRGFVYDYGDEDHRTVVQLLVGKLLEGEYLITGGEVHEVVSAESRDYDDEGLRWTVYTPWEVGDGEE